MKSDLPSPTQPLRRLPLNLQELFLLWLIEPLIRLSIHKLDFELRQLVRFQVVKTREIDSDNVADLRFVECMERVNATSLAELLMVRVRLVDVVGDRIGARKKLKVFGFGSHIPEAKLPACGAIAATRFGGHVETDFEFNCAAHATSVVLFERHFVICVE